MTRLDKQALSEQSRNAKRDGIVIFEPHYDGCWLADDPAPFVLHDGADYNRDKRGRKNSGSRMWHRFRCNDPDCPAIVGVRYDVLSAWIGRG